MPLKDKSITTSSKSPTSNTGIHTPVQFVKGVGPKLGSIFNSRGIESIRDLLHFFPRTYEDRTLVAKISDLQEGMRATLPVRVLSQRSIPIRKLGRSLFEVRCAHESGTLSLKWFYPPRGMEKRFQLGAQMVVSGKIKFYQGLPEIVHPEITWGVQSELAEEAGDQPDFGRLIPVYTEIEGVSTRTLRRVLWNALDKYIGELHEDLPKYILEKRRLPRLPDAIRSVHFPEETLSLQTLVDCRTPAHQRLIYGEFFRFEYLILRRRLMAQKIGALKFGRPASLKHVAAMRQLLPFGLTSGQAKAVDEILSDVSQPHPMSRLVQGDVGSGKTVVAFLSVACVLHEGGQAVLMVPTEILAEQHFQNASRLFGEKLPVVLLTGKTPQSERTALRARLTEGEPLLVIGTHALLEDWVKFARLDYVIIDEQHRFGVEQRRILKNKGIRTQDDGSAIHPHSLILSATPIPRTLALTAFGDLAVTAIRELPPGRSPVSTHVVRDRTQKSKAYQRIRQELADGRQAYFIYPLINESEAEGFTQLKSAVAEAERLAKEVFPEYRVGLLHGQMKNEEKVAMMADFKAKKIQILVSTTVVEVGVDVPNATVMAIEHAERFGLSQLHQLRGRVGRGQAQSYCYLFTGMSAEGTTAQRLEVLEQTQDGFLIAEADLEIRGPGEFLGIRQSGGLPFRVANLVRDAEWLQVAREDAIEILKRDPELTEPRHASLKRYFSSEGGVQVERLQTF